jgi:hypothetical protein
MGPIPPQLACFGNFRPRSSGLQYSVLINTRSGTQLYRNFRSRDIAGYFFTNADILSSPFVDLAGGATCIIPTSRESVVS